MIRTCLLVLMVVLVGLCPCYAGKYNEVLNIGDAAPAWKDLPGVDGKQHSLADLKDKKLVLVVFTCNSCPYALEYEGRIADYARAHADDVAVVAINVNLIAEDNLEAMKARAESEKFPYPYLFDATQQIARQYGATFTPEFFLLDAERKIAFMGGMDDSSNAEEVKHRYLEEATAALLAGKAPTGAEAVARGCRIRYARERRK